MIPIHQLALCVFPALVLIAALRDATSYTIPNWISLLAAAAFLPAALAAGLPPVALAWGLGLGLLTLFIGAGMFALGWIGGGDAKLFAACGLWIGWSAFVPFLLITTVTGGALAVGLLWGRRASNHLPLAAPSWIKRLLTPGENVPYGVAIAVGALAAFPMSPLVRAAGLAG